MSDSINSNTVVNTGYSATQVNAEVSGTQVNAGGDNPLGNSLELSPGIVLDGGYTVTGRIGSATASGEADIFLCEKDGKKAFLLAESFMPAQEFHVIRNPEHMQDPWYYEEELTYPFRTVSYTFPEGSLKRPIYLE